MLLKAYSCTFSATVMLCVQCTACSEPNVSGLGRLLHGTLCILGAYTVHAWCMQCKCVTAISNSYQYRLSVPAISTSSSCSSRATVKLSDFDCRYANIGGMGFQEKLVLQKKAQHAIESGEKPPNVLGMDEALEGTEMQQQR